MERFNALARWDWEKSEDPVVSLGELEIDAGRAARSLVEHVVDHGDYLKSTALITAPISLPT